MTTPELKRAPFFDETADCVATVKIPNYLADQVQRVPSPFMRVDLSREELSVLEAQLPVDKAQALLASRRKHVMIQIGFVPCDENIAWLFRVLPPRDPQDKVQKVWSQLNEFERDSLLDGTVQTVQAMFQRFAN